MSIKERTIPVFLYPSELTFYVGTQGSHKQMLTLYNPYDFPVKYQVYSNTGDKYGVVEPKGTIAPHSYIDLVIRHHAPLHINCHSRDKFKIIMYDATTSQLLGRRYLSATLLPGEKEGSEDGSHSYTACESSPVREITTGGHEQDPSVKTYFIFLSVVLTVILFFPTKCDQADEQQSNIPSYLHVAVPIKIIIAYILGIITIALMRPC